MIAYESIRRRLQNLFDDVSDEYAVQIREAVNTAYREICSEHIWQTLLSNPTFTGSVLPSDLERPVVYVQDDTDFLQFNISETGRYQGFHLFNWYYDGAVETPLVTGSDGVTIINGTTFTSASPSTAFNATTDTLVGEYIQIGGNEGIYKIESVTDANTLVLERGFRGANIDNPSHQTALVSQYYEIRPRGTLKIGFTDEDGTAITSTTRDIWYQRRPLPLYNDYDQLALPGNCEAVRIKAYQMLLNGLKYDNDSLKKDGSYRDAINRMKPLSPTVGRKPLPRNKLGNTIMFGRNRMVDRYNSSNRRFL